MLDVVGLYDIPEIPYVGATARAGVDPVIHNVDLDDEAAFETFLLKPFVQLGDEALTSETEAILISRFKPPYNEKLFANYPNIIGGMRSKGYTYTDLIIERLPAFLSTDHCSTDSSGTHLTAA
jgi:hypothetical protein